MTPTIEKGINEDLIFYIFYREATIACLDAIPERYLSCKPVSKKFIRHL